MRATKQFNNVDTQSKITINTDVAEKIGVTIPQSITDRAEVKNAPSES